VKGRDRGAEGRRRVALNEQPVRGVIREDAVQGLEGARGDLVGRLVGAHEVEVDVGPDLEEIEDLVEHLAVLRGRADDGLEARGLPLEAADDRGELDRLRPRSHDDQDPERSRHRVRRPCVEVLLCMAIVGPTPMLS